jgi:hypothetical protein
MWQSCHKWRTISHMWSIFCFTCVKYASPFFWHMVCQIRLKWSQQRIIVKHILHNMCQMWLCAGARFTLARKKCAKSQVVIVQFLIRKAFTGGIDYDCNEPRGPEIYSKCFLCTTQPHSINCMSIYSYMHQIMYTVAGNIFFHFISFHSASLAMTTL